MLQLMKTKPFQIGKFGKQLADLHCSFIEMTVKDLPKQMDILERGIKKRDYLTDHLYCTDKILNAEIKNFRHFGEMMPPLLN